MVDTRSLNGEQLKLMKILSGFNLNLVCLDTYFFITPWSKTVMNYSFENSRREGMENVHICTSRGWEVLVNIFCTNGFGFESLA